MWKSWENTELSQETKGSSPSSITWLLGHFRQLSISWQGGGLGFILLIQKIKELKLISIPLSSLEL